MVLLMLIPLLAPSDSGALGLGKIAKALGVAAIKAVVAIVTIIAGGRTLLRPLYRRIAALENTEIFAATTLLVVLGTSVMTQIAGLSLALGAFLVSISAVLPSNNLVQKKGHVMIIMVASLFVLAHCIAEGVVLGPLCEFCVVFA